MSLVEPLSELQDKELDRLAQLYREALGFVPNSLLTLQRRPALAKALVPLMAVVMGPGDRVTQELKRLIAEVASAAAGCRYCQAHAARSALRSGASRERIESVWAWERSPLFTPAEKSAFAFAQAAASIPNGVDDAIAAELRRWWSDEEIVDILAVIAMFGFMNRWNDSMGTPLEPEAREEAAAVLGPQGWTPGKHA